MHAGLRREVEQPVTTVMVPVAAPMVENGDGGDAHTTLTTLAQLGTWAATNEVLLVEVDVLPHSVSCRDSVGHVHARATL